MTFALHGDRCRARPGTHCSISQIEIGRPSGLDLHVLSLDACSHRATRCHLRHLSRVSRCAHRGVGCPGPSDSSCVRPLCLAYDTVVTDRALRRSNSLIGRLARVIDRFRADARHLQSNLRSCAATNGRAVPRDIHSLAENRDHRPRSATFARRGQQYPNPHRWRGQERLRIEGMIEELDVHDGQLVVSSQSNNFRARSRWHLSASGSSVRPPRPVGSSQTRSSSVWPPATSLHSRLGSHPLCVRWRSRTRSAGDPHARAAH